MADIKWNEFRSLHKGLEKEEISELWAQYKEGEYEIPSQEAEEQPTEDTVEETVEEVVEEPDVDPLVEFGKLFNELFNNPTLSEGEIKNLRTELMKVAKLTITKTMFVNPMRMKLNVPKAAVLCNESKDVAFVATEVGGTLSITGHLCAMLKLAQKHKRFTVWQITSEERPVHRRVPIPSIKIRYPLRWKSSTRKGELEPLTVESSPNN